MSAEIRTTSGVVLAVVKPPGEYAQCSSCPVQLQRTSSGSLTDGVQAHYKTVHPERNLR